MPQMVGTTVGVSCFLLLAVLAFLIHSRRKASIAAAIKQTHPASPSGAALDPSHMSPKLASTLQALNGLTAAESPLTTSGKLQAVSSMLNSLVMSKSVNKEVDTILARHRDGTAPLTPSSLSMLTTLAGLGPETGNELGRTRTRYPSDDKWNSALSKLDQSSGVPGQLSAHPSSGLETESGAWPLGATVSITLDSSKPSQQLSQGASMGLSLGNLQLGSQQLSQGLGQALTQGLGTCSSRGLGQASSQGLAPTQSASQDSSQGTQPSLDSSNRSSPAAGKMISTQPASLASTQAAQATGSPRAAASGIAAGAGQGAKGMSPQQAMQMQPRPAPPAPDPGMAWCANNLLASNSGTVSTFVTLTRQLGAGSFGTVYAGIWGNTEVAVKIIAHTPAAAQRVKNEVELSLRLDHPNVVRSFFYETFDLQCAAGQEARTMGRDTQETWIVLELCTAGSLSSRLYSASHGQARSSRGRDDEAVPMPLPMKLRDPMLSTMTRLLQVALGVAQGMAYLHSLSITHGDLKTENVLLTTDSNGNTVAKVGDFGLSRAMGDNCPTHLSTATVGTVTHMPPELLSEGRLRPSCDVYSFGIILWQLFTGEVPYAGMHYAVIVYQVTSRGMRPVFPDSAPPAFRLLAERCWAAEEASRPSFPEIITYLAGRGSGADGSAAVSSSELTARSWGSSSNNTNTTASSSTTTASSARTNTTSASSSSGSGGGSSTMGSDHTLESGVSDKRAARTPGPSTPAPSPPLLPPLESEPGLPAPAFAFSPPSPPWALHPPQQPAMEQQGQGEQRGWQQQGSYPQPLLQIPSEVQQALAPAPLPLLPELTSLPSGAMPWASAPELHAILAALASPGGEGPLPGPSWPAQAQGADTLSSGFMTSSSITAAAAAATAAAAGQQGGGGSGGGGGGASAAAAGPAWPSLHGQSAQSLAEHVSGLLAPSTSVEQALALHSYYQLLLRDQQADGAPG
ncbi:kinase-like domain-containing protein [Haematococcus lacustris]